MTETDYIEITPYKFKQVFFGDLSESDLSEDERAIYQIFRMGFDFAEQYLTILATAKLDPEAAKQAYNKIYSDNAEEC